MAATAISLDPRSAPFLDRRHSPRNGSMSLGGSLGMPDCLTRTPLTPGNRVPPIPGLLPNKEYVRDLNTAVQSFNALASFMPADVDAPRFREVHQGILRDLAQLRRDVANHQQRCEHLRASIRAVSLQQAAELARLHPTSAWYEQGNLLSLDNGLLDAALQSRPLESPSAFARYIRRAAGADTAAARRKYGAALPSLADGFAQKLMTMICALSSGPHSAKAVLHSYVWVKAEVLRLGYRNVNQADIKAGSPIADVVLFEILEHRPAASSRRISQEIYYNAASLRRSLWDAWHTSCHPEVGNSEIYVDDRDGESVGPCWHGHNEKLMRALNRRAKSEIERAVWLAVTPRLPEELAEIIFKFTLAAEGIPEDAEVREGKEGFKTEYRCASHGALLTLGWL